MADPAPASHEPRGLSFTALRRSVERDLRTGPEVRDAVYLSVGDSSAKRSRFWLLLVLAGMIATAGVVGDSTATVIGAMIVAPLAIPIQGVAAGIAAGEPEPLFDSLGTLLLAMAVVIGIGALGGEVLPPLHTLADNSQVTSRVSPTLVDLAAAVATGLAGAFAIARRDIGDILPGVAIAISLVPPLAVVGVTAVHGDWDGALGALLLFATNVLAIIVVCALLFGMLGVLRDEPHPSASAGLHRGRVLVIVSGAVLVVVLALAATTLRTVRLTSHQSAATAAPQAWAHDTGEHLLRTTYAIGTLEVTVEGERSTTDTAALQRRLQGAVPKGTTIVINRVAGQRITVGAVR